MTLILKGTNRFWTHPGLVALIKGKTGWDERRVRSFLAENEQVNFNEMKKPQALALLEELERMGFQIALTESKKAVIASLAMPFENELAEVRQQMGNLFSRLKQLEESKGIAAQGASVQEHPVYQKLARSAEAGPEPAEPQASLEESRAGSRGESNIGKYWLSRIGIFTLVLGIGLFISYSFQFIGAWGKVMTGVCIGAFMILAANFLARRESYRSWAMAMIGGGWAILYFTVYAAHNIPATRVITNPYIGFACLLAVIMGSVSQSLKYKSAVLVFFSYFLGFVAITMGGISFYTLAASYLLGVSVVVVTKKTGWNWLALLGLAAVYLAHYFWLEPSLYWMGQGLEGQENIWDALALPWAGDEWRIYPLTIGEDKSLIHQAFLVLYWLLFTAMGFFGKEENKEDRNLRFALLAANSFFFAASYIHHLHVYYPGWKYIFTFIMTGVFLLLFAVEEKSGRKLIADLYLAFSVLLAALTVPMYFDGPWISYAWSGAALLLAWLGTRHGRRVLRILAWSLAALVAWRLFALDYAERKILFEFAMPFRESFFIFMAAAAAYFGSFLLYRQSGRIQEKEKKISQDILILAAAVALGTGFLVGGLRAASSVIGVAEGIALLYFGIVANRRALRVSWIVFLGLAVIRLDGVDCDLGFRRMFSDPEILVRLGAVMLAVIAVVSFSDWTQKIRKKYSLEPWIFPVVSVLGSFLLMRYFYDPEISSWISIIWGAFAFIFIISGFNAREKVYRWIGLGIFACVLLRLFLHDFSKLATLYRIVSFMGLGIVFIAASFLYSYYSRILLTTSTETKQRA